LRESTRREQLFWLVAVQREKRLEAARLRRGSREETEKEKENKAMKKFLMAALVASMLIPAASFAQVGVVVRVHPPAPIVEHYGPPPHRGWVWAGGYHRWDGARYVWVPGQWMRPPRPHAVWVQGHWRSRRGGWVFVEGHWR
jgi:WXXGXW repeat (2 copies)